MSVASRIMTALAPLAIPAAQMNYDGNADTYMVFRIDRIPALYADDDPQAERCVCIIDLYAPYTVNTTQLQKRVRAAIRGAGFTCPGIINVSESARASDGTEQHFRFTFEDCEGIDYGN